MLKKALFAVSLLSSVVFYSSLAFSADFSLKYKYAFDMVNEGHEGRVVINRTVTTATSVSDSKKDSSSSSQKSSGIVNNNRSTKQLDTRRPVNTYQDFKNGMIFIP